MLCLVVIPAAVFTYATSQPPPHVSRATATQRATREAIAYLRRHGYRHISCSRQGQDGALTCQADDPARPNTTYYVLVNSDSR